MTHSSNITELPKHATPTMKAVSGIRLILDSDLPDWSWYEVYIQDLLKDLRIELVENPDFEPLNAVKVSDQSIMEWLENLVETVSK